MKKCKKCSREFKNQKALDQHHRSPKSCKIGTICPKCGKDFTAPSMLKRHLKRKKPCVPEEVPVISEENVENRCQFCNNTYSTPSNLKRHQTTCDKDKNLEALVRIMIEQNKQQNEKIDMLTKQLVVPGQTTINNDNRQLNIQFVNFPIHDMSSIDMKEVLRIVDNSPSGQIIPAIVEHIHGNPNHPEKQNIFMTKIDSDVTIVYGGLQEKTWHPVPRQEAFCQLKAEAMGILTHRNQPRPNFKLLEAAQEMSHKDTSYQDKISNLTDDSTDDDDLAKKLVGFGNRFHETLKIKL